MLAVGQSRLPAARKERLRLGDRPTISVPGLLFGLREARGVPNARGRPAAQRTGGQVPAVAAKVFGSLSRPTLAEQPTQGSEVALDGPVDPSPAFYERYPRF